MGVLRAKCVIVGDSTVGKSAMTQVFHSDGTMFPKSYTMTTGVEVCQKLMPLDEKNEFVDIFVFDSAGKEVFSEICENHWDEIGLFALVFDVTNIETLESCKKWRQKLVGHFNPKKIVPSVLVGNKTDLEQRRQVSYEEGKEVAEQLAMEYFECSAKLNEGVDSPFQHLAKTLSQTYNDSRDSVQLLEQ